MTRTIIPLFASLGVLSLLILACETVVPEEPGGLEEPREPLFDVTLTLVQTYGEPGMGLDGEEVGGIAGGGILGAISDVAVGPDEAVYVLDQDYKKVVVFNPEGDVRRVILGGFGEGPGEFRLPNTLDLTPDGRVVVFDYTLRRVTVFSPEGEYLSSFNTKWVGRDLLAFDDRILLTRMPSREKMVFGLGMDGKDFFEAAEVSERDLEFHLRGTVAKLGRSEAGLTLLAPLRPGVWFTMEEGMDLEERGSEALKDSTYAIVNQIPVYAGHTVGIGGLNGARVAILWMESYRVADSMGINGMYLDLFTESGDFLGNTALADPWVASFTTAPATDFVYAAVTDPFPQIKKYRVSVAGLER